MIVIGIGHKARHGKNYLGQQIVMEAARRGLIAKEYGFAGALKAVCRVQFGMTTKDAPLLQMVGTDLYRRQNPNVWVNALSYQILEEGPDIAVITDMRFPNEAEAVVQQFDGITINVQRFEADGKAYLALDRSPNHLSEIALDGWPYDFCVRARSGEVEHLTKAAKFILDQLAFPETPRERCGETTEFAVNPAVVNNSPACESMRPTFGDAERCMAPVSDFSCSYRRGHGKFHVAFVGHSLNNTRLAERMEP